MDVEEAKKTAFKRTAAEVFGENERETDDYYLNYFQHFKVPTDAWVVIQKAQQDTGLYYRHLMSNRILLILKRVDPITTHTICYYIGFMQKEDTKVCVIELPINENDVEDDKMGMMIFNIAQIDAQYENEEEHIASVDALNHFYYFTSRMSSKSVNVLNQAAEDESATKKRRGGGKGKKNKK